MKPSMRKHEKQMNHALSNKTNWKGSNTEVCYLPETNCSSVYLHGHNIATYDHNTQGLKLSSCGYETVTTKSRLNAILFELKTGCKVFQKNWNWFLSNVSGATTYFQDGMILLDESSLEIV